KIEKAPPNPQVAPVHLSLQREWDVTDTGLVAVGGLSALVGGGLLIYSHHLDGDHAGPLSVYARRVNQARRFRIAAGACLAGGAIAIGAALLRYQFRLVETTVEVQPTSGGA